MSSCGLQHSKDRMASRFSAGAAEFVPGKSTSSPDGDFFFEPFLPIDNFASENQHDAEGSRGSRLDEHSMSGTSLRAVRLALRDTEALLRLSGPDFDSLISAHAEFQQFWRSVLVHRARWYDPILDDAEQPTAIRTSPVLAALDRNIICLAQKMLGDGHSGDIGPGVDHSPGRRRVEWLHACGLLDWTRWMDLCTLWANPSLCRPENTHATVETLRRMLRSALGVSPQLWHDARTFFASLPGILRGLHTQAIHTLQKHGMQRSGPSLPGAGSTVHLARDLASLSLQVEGQNTLRELLRYLLDVCETVRATISVEPNLLLAWDAAAVGRGEASPEEEDDDEEEAAVAGEASASFEDLLHPDGLIAAFNEVYCSMLPLCVAALAPDKLTMLRPASIAHRISEARHHCQGRVSTVPSDFRHLITVLCEPEPEEPIPPLSGETQVWWASMETGDAILDILRRYWGSKLFRKGDTPARFPALPWRFDSRSDEPPASDLMDRLLEQWLNFIDTTSSGAWETSVASFGSRLVTHFAATVITAGLVSGSSRVTVLGHDAIPERLRSRVSELDAPQLDSLQEAKVTDPDSSLSEERAAVERLQQVVPDQPRRAILAALRRQGGSMEAALATLLDSSVTSEALDATPPVQPRHIGKDSGVAANPFPELREDSAMHLRMKELVRLRSWDMYDDEYDDTMDMEATYAVDDGAEEDEERQSRVASVPGSALARPTDAPSETGGKARGAARGAARGGGSARGKTEPARGRGRERGRSRNRKRGSSRGGRGK